MPITISLPAREAFTGEAVRSALLSLLPDTRTGTPRTVPAAPKTEPRPMELPEAA
jgi:hypothetical protein